MEGCHHVFVYSLAIIRLLNNLKFHYIFLLCKSIIRCPLTTTRNSTSFTNILCTLLPLKYQPHYELERTFIPDEHFILPTTVITFNKINNFLIPSNTKFMFEFLHFSQKCLFRIHVFEPGSKQGLYIIFCCCDP